MKDQLVSFTTAKLAKEKDFDEYCFNGYRVSSKELLPLSQLDFDTIYDNQEDIDKVFRELFFKNSEVVKNYSITAPTQSLLQRWLREKHNLIIWIQPSAISPESIFYPKIDTKQNVGILGSYNSYEEALEIALQRALSLIDCEEDNIETIVNQKFED